MTSLEGDVFDPFRADYVEKSEDESEDACEIMSPPPRAAQLLVDLLGEDSRREKIDLDTTLFGTLEKHQRRALKKFLFKVLDTPTEQPSTCC